MSNVDHRVLGEARDGEEIHNLLALGILEPVGPVSGHAGEPERELGADVALLRLAVHAVLTVCQKERDHPVAHLDVLHVFTHALHHSVNKRSINQDQTRRMMTNLLISAG